MRMIVAMTVALAAVAGPAVAQQHGQPQHGQGMHGMQEMGMQGMQGCMRMMGGPPPAMVLQHREELGLTADQVSRLETLEDQAGARSHMTEAMTAHARAAEALEADEPDWTAYETALRAAADHMVQAHTAMARAAVAAKGVLTPAQQEQLSGVGHGMDGMMGGDGAGHSGMMGCMMMGGMSGMGGHDAGGAGHGH